VNAPDENPSGLGTFTCNLRFPGQYFDRETNLHYNYFRDYDPALGRYIESDPVGLKGGNNTYTYVHDPLSQIDPYGLMGRGIPNKPLQSNVSVRFGGGAALPGTCGAGWNEPLVPDAFLGIVNFTEACQKHDECYRRCDASKQTCDIDFRRDIRSECDKVPPGGLQSLCKTTAVNYAVAVQTWGTSAFNKAQTECRCR
jgi:RHS repeat-associated protein